MSRTSSIALLFLLWLCGGTSTAAQIGPSKFDHLTTGFELLGAHLNVACESCHVDAIFKGTPRNCASCHSIGVRVSATFKQQDHVLSSDRCDSCHGPVAWKPVIHFDHQEVQGSCATCHNGVSAQGKTLNHIAATMECDACHSVFGWKPVIRVDHLQVNGTCMSCHDGRTATGKPANHIATTDSCDNCHSTFQWKPANVSHKGDVSNCVACHNGAIATGKTQTHIATSNQCAACHTVIAWKPVVSVDHTQVSGSCASCHDGKTAKGKPASHPQTDNNCGNCHSTTAFRPANVNHNGITDNCASCHDGKTATGKPASHISTSNACQACHSVLVWKPQVTVDHTQVQGTCASCHNGSIAMGRAANHIPASADCGVCHLSTVVFGPGTVMNHSGISSGCATCHETGKAWLGVTNLVTRPTRAQDPNHPATGDCSQCHSSTTSFRVDVTGGKPANHIPTSQACSMCHTDPGDYAIYKMNHVGITSNCAQCHGRGLSFANIVPKQPPANHLPTTTACENCHSPGNFTAFGPGTPMSHTGITSNCQSCHETGMSWYGVTMITRPTKTQDPNHPATGDCAQCHTSTTSFAVVSAGKPANHIPTTQACTLCHTNPNDYSVYRMDHTGITSGCATCHAAGLSFANIVPKQQPANHIPVGSLPCENCHSRTNFGAFGPGTAMNHSGIAGTCQSCHETGMSWYGVTMVTRPTAAQDPNHPRTGECSNCHSSTVNFAQGVTGGNKPANHIPTAQVCTLCHSNTKDYSIYKMDHSGITGNCAQCHAAGLSFANIVPKAPPANHIPVSSLPCENCHSPSQFTAFGPGTAMNHTGITGNCASCHETGKTFFGVTMVTRPTAAQDPNHPASGDCSQCHSSTQSFTTGLAKPANHIPTTQACTLCHTNPGNYAVYTMNHSGISGNCAQCHAAGLSFANIVPKAPPANHIPVGALPCENCHSASQFTAFGPGTPMSHAGISGNCASCHETGKAFFGVTMVTRPTAAQDPNHPTSGDCSQCHNSTTSFAQGVTQKPANHIPTVQACTLCHSNPKDYSVFKMNHQGIVGNCIQCHNTGLSFANIVPKAPPANHIPTKSVACEGCHSAANFTTFGGTKMNHTPVAAFTCMTCHESGMSWFGVSPKTRPDGHHTGQDCKGCHNTSDWNAANGNVIKSLAKSKVVTTPGAGNGPANSAAATAAPRAPLNSPKIPPEPATAARFNLAAAMARMNGLRASPGAMRVTGSSAFDHAGTRRTCLSCHNGLTASGKSTRHIPSNNSCDNCHTVNAWAPARFEHSGVTIACQQCHDSVHATGKPARHVPTQVACSNCHSTMAWLPVIFRHSGISGNCSSCHNGIGASGRPLAHMTSSLDCASCHNISTWSAVTYRHVSPRYPGEHRADLTCAQCHTTGTERIPWSNPALAPACAACHERNYKPAPHVKYGNVRYTAAELRDCTGACHTYSDEALKAIVRPRPGPRHQVSSGQF